MQSKEYKFKKVKERKKIFAGRLFILVSLACNLNLSIFELQLLIKNQTIY